MGCDIHLHIEYKERNSNIWFNFGHGFRLNRNYIAFAFLADVRNEYHQIDCPIKPRGLPKDICNTTLFDFVYEIGDEDVCYGEPQICSKETAEECLKHGSYIIKDKYISDPDFHSETWLSYDEFAELFDYKLDGQHLSNIYKYEAVYKAMECLEYHGYDTRVVFWFDN